MILVAVSGGSDSKGLLLALHAAIRQGGYPGFSIAACTIDHSLRSSSADEAEIVAALCRDLGIAHVTRAWLGEKPVTGIQAAARETRYRLLADVAAALNAGCIVTGHTADDQVETITMREHRSQPDAAGLAGMAKAVLIDRRLWVLRPFLALRRATIRDYLSSTGETWLDDPSNANPDFERVRIRRLLTEIDVSDKDPSETAGEKRRLSSENAARLLRQHVVVVDGLAARVDPVLAENMTDRDCSRAILSLAAVIGGRAYLAGMDTATRLRAFASSGENGRMTAGRVVFDRRSSGLYLYREARGLPTIAVQPHRSAVWDGRFVITNRSEQAIVVGSRGDPARFDPGPIAAALPEQIFKRAVKAAPVYAGAQAGAVTIEPQIGLYDTFLPCFDRMMANSIAAIFGRDPYPVLPVHDVFTEKPGF